MRKSRTRILKQHGRGVHPEKGHTKVLKQRRGRCILERGTQEFQIDAEGGLSRKDILELQNILEDG